MEHRFSTKIIPIRLMEFVRKTNALTYLPSLLESQWWDTDKLLQDQNRKLNKLCSYCNECVPYYQKVFNELNIPLDKIGEEDVFQNIPLMTKDIATKSHSMLLSGHFKKWKPRAKHTSGSTGKPFNYYQDINSHSMEWAHIWRGWSLAGYEPGMKYAALSGGSLLPQKVDFKQWAYLKLCNVVHLPSYHLTDKILLQYYNILVDKRVKLLYGYPSSVGILSEFIHNKKLRPIPLNGVFTTSECLTNKTRASIESAFNCAVFDTYGCNDGGIYTFECQHHSGYHIGMESAFVEIVDDNGKNLPEGEIGRIVVTNLAMRAMPLLRYVTGDVGAIDTSPCPCGRGLIRIVNLQGRDRDFIITADGRKVHGAFFNHFEPFYKTEWLEQFQIYQPEKGALVLRFKVKGNNPSSEDVAEILNELSKGLGPMRFKIEYVEKMELTRTGKFRVVITDIVD